MSSNVDACPHGHERTPDNWRPRKVRGKDAYYCRPCDLERLRVKYAAKQAGTWVPKRAPYDPQMYPCGHPRTPQNTTSNVHCRECHRHRGLEDYRTDPIRYKVWSWNWRQRNLEDARAYDRRRRSTRPDTELARLSRVARVEDMRNPETQEYLSIIMKDPCVHCGGEVNTRDHILPISAGGPNRWYNYAPACMGCNSAKGNKSLLDFLLDKRLVLEARERSA